LLGSVVSFLYAIYHIMVKIFQCFVPTEFGKRCNRISSWRDLVPVNLNHFCNAKYVRLFVKKLYKILFCPSDVTSKAKNVGL